MPSPFSFGCILMCLRYTLEYRRGDSEIWLHLNATVDVYSGVHCVSGLSPETPYSFRLSFQNEHGTSEHMHTQATTSLGKSVYCIVPMHNYCIKCTSECSCNSVIVFSSACNFYVDWEFTTCSTIGTYLSFVFMHIVYLLLVCLFVCWIYSTHAHTHTHTRTHIRTGVPGKPSRPIVSDPSPTSVSAQVFFTDLGSRDLQGLSANITQTSSGQTHTQYLQVPAGQQVYQVNGLEGEGRAGDGSEWRGGEGWEYE